MKIIFNLILFLNVCVSLVCVCVEGGREGGREGVSGWELERLDGGWLLVYEI